MINEKIKYMYFYNIQQVNFYINHGCRIVETGINPNTNKVWYKFKKDETEDVYALWMKNK